MRTICFEKTNVILVGYLDQQCSVHCFLKLYADHMFWFYRENRCDPRCVFGPAVQCTLFIGSICGPFVHSLKQM